ncbi:PilZ domain-containing protein [Vibrio penaeicida]|uniref:PilZ domain-containing protein n=1 Tax=Vibrio penaeicida TaxID=104609 RepID=UPI002735C1CD|nr:PilZ domain-containing protein [Vibrio penaeicida]MDP2571263.1 PilZ domain-containing protein [Vibrio penaeicida]
MSQQEYFTVQHGLSVNIEPLDSEFTLPDLEQFVTEIPAPFLVASEFSSLDTVTEKAIGELRSSDLSHVVQLLETQNSKLNLLLTYMLSQQNDPAFSHTTTSFGASQFTYFSKSAPQLGQQVRTKIFLEFPAAAIYCYGEVVECEALTEREENEQSHKITISFSLLREEDQDLLIKAALHQQQKLLRQRSLERDRK